jgi:hypothetical protein
MRRTSLVAPCVTAMAIALLLATAVGASVKLPAAGTAKTIAKQVAASTKIKTLSATLLKQVATAANDNPGKLYPQTYDGCQKLASCVFGDTKSKKVVVIFGDSHAQMWIPALNRIGIAKKLDVIVLYLPSCPAATLSVWLKYSNTAFPQCSSERANWINEINALHPTTVLITDHTEGVYSAASGGTATFTAAQWQAGMETTLVALAPSKSKLAIIGDMDTFDAPIPACLASNTSDAQACEAPNPNPERPGRQSAEQAAAKAETVLYVNPMQWLCTSTACSPVIGNFVAYFDQYHLTCSYAAYLSGVLGDALRPVL